MDAEAIARARLREQALKGGQIGPRARTHSHPFAAGQANVVAPFLFHARQDLILTDGQVNVYGAARLYGLPRKPETITGQASRQRQAVRQIWLQFEEIAAPPPRARFDGPQQVRAEGRLFPINHGAFGHIGEGLSPGRATKKNLRASHQRAVGAQRHAFDLPANTGLQFAPTTGLEQMAVRMRGHKSVPGCGVKLGVRQDRQ